MSDHDQCNKEIRRLREVVRELQDENSSLADALRDLLHAIRHRTSVGRDLIHEVAMAQKALMESNCGAG